MSPDCLIDLALGFGLVLFGMAGIAGGGYGLVSKHRRVHGVANISATYAANFAIVMGCYCGEFLGRVSLSESAYMRSRSFSFCRELLEAMVFLDIVSLTLNGVERSRLGASTVRKKLVAAYAALNF